MRAAAHEVIQRSVLPVSHAEDIYFDHDIPIPRVRVTGNHQMRVKVGVGSKFHHT